MNVSDNRLVYITLASSTRNKTILRKFCNLVYYRERELKLLLLTTLVSSTIYTNISEIFIHHNHLNMHRLYHLLYEISILQSFVLFQNNNINKLGSTLSKNLFILLSTTTLDYISSSPRKRFYPISSESYFANKFEYYSLRIEARRHIYYQVYNKNLAEKRLYF